jgi:hypothetical protein
MSINPAVAGDAPVAPPAPGVDAQSGDVRFYRNLLTVMAIVLVSGFVVQLAAGRSSFAAPPVVHAHALVFMGWVAIVLTQAWLAGAGSFANHRQLGRVAAVWAVALVVMGPLVTLESIRTGRAPFFFQPQHFLLVNSTSVLVWAGVFAAAVALRRNAAWHVRLQVAAFFLLLGPGFGRLLPAPLMMPYAYEICAAAGAIFLAVAMIRDWRVQGRVHVVWLITLAVFVSWLATARLVAFTPIGDSLYAAATAGAPAEGTNGRAFPPPPPMAPAPAVN